MSVLPDACFGSVFCKGEEILKRTIFLLIQILRDVDAGIWKEKNNEQMRFCNVCEVCKSGAQIAFE